MEQGPTCKCPIVLFAELFLPFPNPSSSLPPPEPRSPFSMVPPPQQPWLGVSVHVVAGGSSSSSSSSSLFASCSSSRRSRPLTTAPALPRLRVVEEDRFHHTPASSTWASIRLFVVADSLDGMIRVAIVIGVLYLH
ncbi:hypothetical protein SEVIR_2G439100v4 [Setaria viridis]|uniref:Uncharacterized protein n=1 Tax=Setaria viridis TaxID=4556 RepID=A0A4U6W1W8_SETVI|nr:hypothetical protein SEVIR_2G439100v2 [Setaria viridis]